jgi:amidase
MSTFLLRLPVSGAPAGAVRVAVKDLVDLRGTPTTCGSPAVAVRCLPAERDAACLAGIRAAERRGAAVIVGKTNLHELAFGGDGINPHYGTPLNPLDADRVPGGSSSGSAVAVAAGEADVALGSDTGGSIRIPSHCCGTAGLKTTWGRVPLEGVAPLAPFLDTIGPMARDVAGVVTGMDLLEPGFAPTVGAAGAGLRGRVVVLRSPGGQPAEAGLDAAVAAVLAGAGIEAVPREAPWWTEAIAASLMVLLGEAWRELGHLLERESHLDARIAARIRMGATIDDGRLASARAIRGRVRDQLGALLEGADAVALPSVPVFAPRRDSRQADDAPYTAYTRVANIAGTPALSVPVPLVAGTAAPEHAHLRASLQLMGAAGAEASLCALGLRVMAAVPVA